VERLDAAPAIISLPDGSQLRVTGDDFIDFVFDAMYDTFYLPYLPADIVRVFNGDTGPLEYLAGYAYYDLGTSLGLYLSVQCVEEIPFNTVERVAQTSHIERIGAFTRNDVLARKADCEVWGVPSAAPFENDPVVSDVPALILSGQFDPVTPPAYAAAAASTLPKSHVVVLPGYGHGVLYEGCPMELMATFLADPESGPDPGCVAELRAEFFE
jgi:pimeloyl-ACP methyl ester carboxylesterase